MGGVFCRKCGEPWDFYYVTHEFAPWERNNFVKGISCPKCQKRNPGLTEKERALSSLIETLNDIETEIKQLADHLRRSPPTVIVTEADSLVNKFFFSCQICDERIKTARRKDYISDVQVRALDNELSDFVRKMIDLSSHSSPLLGAMKRLLEMEPGLQSLLAES